MESYNIENDGVIYHIQKDLYESTDVFLQRAWYIAKKKPTCADSLKRATELSLIWRNHKMHGMQYDKTILKLIQ
jgi:hypothetical protein|tara:strand:+ start:460 stop:681 length:222 start_codon:yes stop_codon:yes gene_type:complete